MGEIRTGVYIRGDRTFQHPKEGKLVPTCKDCKFYELIDESRGSCFGHEVSGDREISQCPTRTFVAK